jgi:galactokinase
MPELYDAFVSAFGAPPAARVDAPGRVNLMGDHIDYAGLSVLPMALQRHISLLIRPRSDATVRLTSNSEPFPPRTFEAGPTVPPFAPGDWGNYAKAAVRELARDSSRCLGFDALVDSTLPIAAGLSSSSALVVAFALAYLHANGRTMAHLELAARMAEAERYVGTRGGGMDQAICLGGREGAACRIDFEPLRVQCIAIPRDWKFVVADSGVRAEKSGPARDAYNARTTGIREARAAVASALGLTPDTAWRPLLALIGDEMVLSVAATVLDGVRFRRFRHVVTEANRVRQAEDAMRRGAIEEFGRLLDASHESLAHDYEVSTAELDRLVALATGAGAAGARLTGAGFGGSVVALCPAPRAADLEDTLLEAYYAPRGLETAARAGLFAARPGGGARLTLL